MHSPKFQSHIYNRVQTNHAVVRNLYLLKNSYHKRIYIIFVQNIKALQQVIICLTVFSPLCSQKRIINSKTTSNKL